MMAGGAALLAAAAAAASAGQPREVWLSLGLLGLVSGLVGGSVYRLTAARYRDFELRRMRAIDA
jgi:high-affinity Fe2+/Pb2+ permease